MYDKDFEALVNDIRKFGLDVFLPPVIAKIKQTFYIVDGHSRIRAVEKTGIEKIPCIVSKSINTMNKLRICSFRLNKGGYSNPLSLSDMFYEELQVMDTVKKVAEAYDVNEKYVESLLKIRELHDDAKSVISKILETARRKYQFILDQLTPEHLAVLCDLSKENQVRVVDWIFRDIIYGPADESMISLPSIFEIIEEISHIDEIKEKKSYKKNTRSAIKQKEFPFTCRCGAKYEVDTRSAEIFEYVEDHNVIIKKKFNTDSTSQVLSSRFYPKKELIELVKNSTDEVRVVVNKEVKCD